MYHVITQQSTYEVDSTNKVFRRIPDTGVGLVRDLEWVPYISINHTHIGESMLIEWSLDGTRKIRTTTPVLNIDLLETEEDYDE